MSLISDCGRVIDGRGFAIRELPPTESSLSQEGIFEDFRARLFHVPSWAQMPMVWWVRE
jgi:hypothetical protein